MNGRKKLPIGTLFSIDANGLNRCYATHLLEEGVSLRLISQYLGHQSLDVTVIYTHLTATNEGQARAALERLLA